MFDYDEENHNDNEDDAVLIKYVGFNVEDDHTELIVLVDLNTFKRNAC